MQQTKLKWRIAGFLGSLILTLASYWIIVSPDFFHLDLRMALNAILILAGAQSIVQFLFFLDVWREKGVPWNLAVFISTVLIIVVIITFSIWVMYHLNENMMPPMH